MQKLEKQLEKDGFVLVEESDSYRIYQKHDFYQAVEKRSGKLWGKAFKKYQPCRD